MFVQVSRFMVSLYAFFKNKIIALIYNNLKRKHSNEMKKKKEDEEQIVESNKENKNKARNKAIKLQGMKRWLEPINLSTSDSFAPWRGVTEFSKIKDPARNYYYKLIYIDQIGKTNCH